MGRKESCSNCYTKMPEPVSFCPVCGRPTPHATDTERLDYDLQQWRSHVDRDVTGSVRLTASGNGSRSAVIAAEPAVTAIVVQPPSRPASSPSPVSKAPAAPKAPKVPRVRKARPERPKRRIRPPKIRVRLPKLPSLPKRADQDRVIVLDADNPFAYNACTSCERADWIVRTTRNEDDTYNYWCVRCSRSFKTEVRIRHALKPFLASGTVIGGLIALSLLMR